MADKLIEWKDAVTHRPLPRIAGYAPGSYMGRCIVCDGRFLDMDKRAYHCLPCAIEATNKRFDQLADELRSAKEENAAFRAVARIVAHPEREPQS